MSGFWIDTPHVRPALTPLYGPSGPYPTRRPHQLNPEHMSDYENPEDLKFAEHLIQFAPKETAAFFNLKHTA